MKYSVVIENIKADISCTDEDIISSARSLLKKNGLLSCVRELAVRKKSIDARKKESIILVCSVCGIINTDKEITRGLPPSIKLSVIEEEQIIHGTVPMKARPVIVGFGPAGMFCALELARHGYAPVVYERGTSICERVASVDRFMNGGEFSPISNIQFGAGGAGTFSDGKLTTRINDPLCRSVLEELCNLGAPSSIKWQAKPHIGTDILRTVVENADREISRLGGIVKYNHKVSDIAAGMVSVCGNDVEYGALVLAIGHSARDTYKELQNSGFAMTPKPFSVGVRIEHLQDDINHAMYGAASEYLPPAEYALSYRTGERGVYTFCMCPGGTVVPAASEEYGIVTNGMSYSGRDGRNSNSAVAVSVLPGDFGNSVEGAIEFQRNLENTAYKHVGNTYAAPAETVGSFIHSKNNSLGRIFPTYMNGNVTMCHLSDILPRYVTEMLSLGITKFGKSISGFDCDDAVLTGIETRTSAPVRILRGEDRRILEKDLDIYPCGEGAGYAGGIMSAAVDGIKTARAIIAKFAPFTK